MLKFALAGNPNCGKTTLFNVLTGSTAHVGNWPGVTVDKREGVYKKGSVPVSVVDLPGIYSLSPYTPEELIARNFILEEKPDCVINIVDATNLERNLYLTTQLLEMDVPVVVALNMMDAVRKKGDALDSARLEKELGVPVAEISALRGEGIGNLMQCAYKAAQKKREGSSVLAHSSLSHLLADVTIALRGEGISHPLFHAVKLAEGDEEEVKAHPQQMQTVRAFQKQCAGEEFAGDLEAQIADARYKYITARFSAVLTRSAKPNTLSGSDKADRVLTHRIWGIPLFLVILFGIFHLTFGEDLFYLNAIFKFGYDVDTGNEILNSFVAVFFSSAGVSTPGVILFNLMDFVCSLAGDGIANGVSAAGAAAWGAGAR